MTEKTKIGIVGSEYADNSFSVLLGCTQDTVMLDINQGRINRVNSGRLTVVDAVKAREILSMTTTRDQKAAYPEAMFIVEVTPADYEPEKNFFNSTSVERNVDGR